MTPHEREEDLKKFFAQVRERRRVDPEVGPTPAFHICIPTGMHWPTCILWANLTPFTLQNREVGPSFELNSNQFTGTKVGELDTIYRTSTPLV